jgi:hypothetical protein
MNIDVFRLIKEFGIFDNNIIKKTFEKIITDKLKFIRTENTITSSWTAAFCDCELCHDVKTDSANFVIGIGDSCTASYHFYPATTKGSGIAKVKVFPRDNRTNSVVGEFKASCFGLSASFLESNKLVVSPNPAKSILNIAFGSGEDYLLSIVSTDGKLIASEMVNGLQHETNIGFLVPGVYSVKVESQGKTYFARFIKQ